VPLRVSTGLVTQRRMHLADRDSPASQNSGSRHLATGQGFPAPPPARWYSSAVSAISDERPVAAPAEDLDSNGNDVRLHRSAVSQRLEQRARPRDDVETNIEPAVRQLGDELRVRQETPEDENGVDRTQIRWMLSQSPEQRLGHIETLVAEILEIWERNGTRPVR